jgi:hypothetical protein
MLNPSSPRHASARDGPSRRASPACGAPAIGCAAGVGRLFRFSAPQPVALCPDVPPARSFTTVRAEPSLPIAPSAHPFSMIEDTARRGFDVSPVAVPRWLAQTALPAERKPRLLALAR